MTENIQLFLSQQRICIEIAFGLLTPKWCIFGRNLGFILKKTSQICWVASILHNYVINDGNSSGDDRIEPFTDPARNIVQPQGLGYMPTTPLTGHNNFSNADEKESESGSETDKKMA